MVTVGIGSYSQYLVLTTLLEIDHCSYKELLQTCKDKNVKQTRKQLYRTLQVLKERLMAERKSDIPIRYYVTELGQKYANLYREKCKQALIAKKISPSETKNFRVLEKIPQ